MQVFTVIKDLCLYFSPDLPDLIACCTTDPLLGMKAKRKHPDIAMMIVLMVIIANIFTCGFKKPMKKKSPFRLFLNHCFIVLCYEKKGIFKTQKSFISHQLPDCSWM